MTSDQDLRYLTASAGALEEYLLSDEIFWELGGAGLLEGPSTRLSLGVLELSLARLSAERLPHEQQEDFSRIKDQIELLKNRWRVAWGRKAAREFRSRLHLWQNYLNETLAERDQPAANYPQQVRMRAMLALLRSAAENVPVEDDALLEGLDRRLKARFTPGEFLWKTELQGAFPKERFWFLYGRL